MVAVRVSVCAGTGVGAVATVRVTATAASASEDDMRCPMILFSERCEARRPDGTILAL
jgi:hypothetical protein